MDKQKLEKIKKILFNRLSKEYDSDMVYMFGSYAYGYPDKDSDIDIAIIVSKSEQPQYKRSRRGYSKIRDVDLPVEILVFTESEVEKASKVNTSLVSTILERGIKLYG